MEKWNTKRAKEVGLDADLISAINVAVEIGREHLTQVTESLGEHTIQFRKELESSGLKLYMFSSLTHPLADAEHPGAEALRELYKKHAKRFSPELHGILNHKNFWFGDEYCRLSGQLFVIADSPEEVIDALVLSMKHNYPREILESSREWLETSIEDVSTRAGWLDSVARIRASKSIDFLKKPTKGGLFFDRRLSKDNMATLAMVRTKAERLIEEELEINSANWQVVTLALTNRDGISLLPSGAISLGQLEIGLVKKYQLAWDFISSLLPEVRENGWDKFEAFLDGIPIDLEFDFSDIDFPDFDSPNDEEASKD